MMKMKYVVFLCDGMADYKIPELDNKTPMTAAKKPIMNELAKNGLIGLVKTVSDGFKPGSDVCNLSVMGYDPKLYYTGRSPLEATSIGVKMLPDDVAMRCNLVTLSDDENYEDKVMVDYCAGDISTDEARELINSLKEAFDSEDFTLYSGVSYRHCLIWHNPNKTIGELTPPHDISDKKITEHLPSCTPLLDMMKKSYEVLKNHPVNLKRIEKGLRPANSMWFWGDGKSVSLPAFSSLTGLSGAVISAVDLIKGIGILADMKVINVEGATGYIDTNFEGKAKACIEALKEVDFVYLHMEAPDECGHRGETQNKVKALEIIDEKVIKTVKKELDEKYDDYSIMVLPDHPTPIAVKTHVNDPVPFLIYRKSKAKLNDSVTVFDEETCKNSDLFVPFGPDLIKKFIEY